MTLRELDERREALGYSYADVAKVIDLPEDEVRAVLAGDTRNLHYLKAFALVALLGEETEGSNCIRETGVYYALADRQGNYTVDDCAKLPEEYRVELIDGVIYQMSAPSVLHQIVVIKLVTALENYMVKKKKACKVLASPLTVLLGEDGKTEVQPDVLVVCDRDKVNVSHIQGAPEFIVEVLSESTRAKDLGPKLNKYRQCDVCECWFVDLKKEKVIVHFMKEMGEEVKIYGFDAKIPVKICEGDLCIDFSRIKAAVDGVTDGITE